MADFPVIPLGDLAAPFRSAVAIGPFGSRMKADNYVASGVPVIRGTNIGPDRALVGEWVYVSEDFADGIVNCQLRSGDLVFPHRGSIGEVALVEEHHGKMLLSSSMMKISPDPEKVDSRYLYYYFKSARGREEVLRFGSQVGTPGIGQPLSSLKQFRVPFPDLRTQSLVASLLSKLDDKIELNRRMNDTLEAMAQAIFREWFVDFGPTSRKLEGATDPVTIMGGVVQDAERAQVLADLFPGTLSDEQLPHGWAVDVAASFVAFNPKEPLKKGARAPYSDMSSLPTTGPIADPPTEREYGSGMRFRNGDALLARITPCLENGKAAFVDFLPTGESVGWGSTEFYVLRSRKGVPAPFAYLLVRHPEFRSTAVESMTGTSGRQRAQLDRLEAFPLAKPSEAVLREFGEFVTPMFEKISANGRENLTLAATRDLLLPKLMSGEIRLREAEEMLEAAQ